MLKNSHVSNKYVTFDEKGKNKDMIETKDNFCFTFVSDKNVNTYSEITQKGNENEKNAKETDFEESINDSSEEESLSECSEEIEEVDIDERNELIFSLANNLKMPFTIKFLLLCLNSELNIIKEYSLLALSSLLDKKKIIKEEEDKEIGPSVIYFILCKVNEWGLLDEIKFYINYCFKIKKTNNYINNINNKRIEINVFNLFYLFIIDCFDMSIIIDEEKRKDFAIKDFCNKRIIEWVSSFYVGTKDKESVIRLLYILISCSEEEVVSSLFSFEESSVFLLLLENNESEYSNNMVCCIKIYIIFDFYFFLSPIFVLFRLSIV